MDRVQSETTPNHCSRAIMLGMQYSHSRECSLVQMEVLCNTQIVNSRYPHSFQCVRARRELRWLLCRSRISGELVN